MAAKAPKTDSSLPAKLLDEARRLRVDIEGRAEEEVRRRVREAWIEENQAAIDSSNAYVEKHGLPLDRFRQF